MASTIRALVILCLLASSYVAAQQEWGAERAAAPFVGIRKLWEIPLTKSRKLTKSRDNFPSWFGGSQVLKNGISHLSPEEKVRVLNERIAQAREMVSSMLNANNS